MGGNGCYRIISSVRRYWFFGQLNLFVYLIFSMLRVYAAVNASYNVHRSRT